MVENIIIVNMFVNLMVENIIIVNMFVNLKVENRVDTDGAVDQDEFD